MKRETKPCPFYGMPCEYVPMAEMAVEQTSEIASLRAENEKLNEAMEMLLTDVRRTDVDMRELKTENEKLRAALSKISEYEIEEGCPCNACQHSAIARAALEGPQDRMAKPLEDEQ